MQLNPAGVSGAGSFRRVTGAEMVAGVSGAGSFRRFPLPPSFPLPPEFAKKWRGCSEKMDFLRCDFSRFLRCHAGGAARMLQSRAGGVASPRILPACSQHAAARLALASGVGSMLVPR